MTLTLAQLARQNQSLTLVITKDTQQAQQLQAELPFFTDETVLLFTDWEVLPYDHFSPHQEITSTRLTCLYQLQTLKKGIVIVPIHALMQKVCPPSFLNRDSFLFRKGDHLSRDQFRSKLEQAGYRAVGQVFERGEFAVRGELFDLFPMGSESPFRLDFFDDEIESIQTFDPSTQRSLATIDKIELLPAHEFPFDKDSIERFRMQFRAHFEVRLEAESIYQQISHGILPNGIEFWQPLFFDSSLCPFLDYLPAQTQIVSIDEWTSAAQKFWRDLHQRYDNQRVDPLRPLLAPQALWQSPDAILSALNAFPKWVLSAHSQTLKHGESLPFKALPLISMNEDHKNPTAPLQQFIRTFNGSILFSVHSEGRKEVLLPILKRLNLKVHLLPQSPDFAALLAPLAAQRSAQKSAQKAPYYALSVTPCETGFIDEAQRFALITENDLMGKLMPHRQKQARKNKQHEQLIQSLAELNIGDPVVHLEHGVGRYQGLITIETHQIPAEYLILSYANDSKLYVPIGALHQISRYLGGDPENAPLNKLGNDAWQKNRDKAAEKVRDVAAELLDLYAQRATKTGFAFRYDEAEYDAFAKTFPYELTLDQKIAIDAVLADMQSEKTMDRLVCGDVGFGKTEVALRAAFLAAMNQKQTAILVPTTLLAQQHYEKFCDRFAPFPLRIEVLSRFKTAKEQKQILADMAQGKIDILIGTHKLLQNELKWHDLGLLIIDEEHRFGVKQKEKIKALRTNVDILTLTATPIPRTLNMALSHMRDLSIIATAPARRLPVKTLVKQWDKNIVREAILREILRGGQLYYLHNEVATIEKKHEELQALLPEISIAIAHGKMHERDLERVMEDFHHQRFQVLLCSTIIETGIDIPNANTIIIERADKFGLAQLHQLRGRVGRSHHQAYAYLLTPPPKQLKKDAKLRLEAIAQLEELGSGFALASHDLEIRGAGELLGNEQSGQMATIGFSLYLEMLEEAIEALKSGKMPTLSDLLKQEQAEVDLHLPCLIPEALIHDVNLRLSFYKRIANAKTEEALLEIKIELADRFGQLPDATLFLFKTAELRLKTERLNIRKIDFSENGGVIEFKAPYLIDIDHLIALIQKSPAEFRLEGANQLKLQKKIKERQARLDYIEALIAQFETQIQSHSKEKSN